MNIQGHDRRGLPNALDSERSREALPDRLLTAQEAAAMLGVQLSTIRRWTSDRKLPICHPGGGRAVRYRLSALLALIERWTRPALRDTAALTGRSG